VWKCSRCNCEVLTDRSRIIDTSEIAEEELYPKFDSQGSLIARGPLIAQSGWSDNDLFPIDGWTFSIAGIEKRGESCGKIVATGFNYEAVKYDKLSCRRMTCPVCYKDWINRSAFRYAVLIESYARWSKERPCCIQSSVRPIDAMSWTWAEYNNKLHRRAIRQMKSIGVVAGVRIFHPYRIRNNIKKELKALGYASSDSDSLGYWRGVRVDALNLNDWREYVMPGPHDHGICFPGFLDPHSHEDIVVRKYATLDYVINVVRHLKYLLSHAGKLPNTATMPTKLFGLFSGVNHWIPEDNLTVAELNSVKHDVAGCLNMIYNEQSDDVEYPIEEDLPEGLTFLPIIDLPRLIRTEWVRGVRTQEELVFWEILSEKTRSREPLLFDDVEEIRPASIEVYHTRDFEDENSEG